MNKFKQIWYWFWGDGSVPHSKIPPYVIRLIVLLFIGGLIYQLFEYLYQLF